MPRPGPTKAGGGSLIFWAKKWLSRFDRFKRFRRGEDGFCPVCRSVQRTKVTIGDAID